MAENAFETSLEDSAPLQIDRSRWYRRYGNCYGFRFNSQDEPSLTIGPHCNPYLGPLSLCLFLCILVVGCLVEVNIAADISVWLFLLGLCIISWCLLFFLAAVTCNPGLELVHQDPVINANNVYFCRVCEVIRASGTVHCSDCEVCVRGHDHHCPWTGKCIGEGNLPYFYGFVMGVMGAVVFVVICAMLQSADTAKRGIRG